jgi:hypothetical protein
MTDRRGDVGASFVTNGKNLRKWIAISARAIVIAGVGYGIFSVARIVIFLVNRPDMTVREYVAIPLPDGIHEIRHSRIRINPLVAEYNRDVTFVANGSAGRSTPLALDTCGGYSINCYVVKTAGGMLLVLNDAISEHLLDPQKQIVYSVTRVGGVGHIEKMTDEEADSGTTLLSDLVGKAKEEYIGTIVGGFGNFRFIPASEQPETPISRLHH